MSKKIEYKKFLCFSCAQSCAAIAKIEDGRVVSTKGDKEHPVSKGFICERCKAGPEILYHKDRINYPLKRKGQRGEGKWEKISWDQALDEIAAKLNRIKQETGPESIALSFGTFRTIKYVGRRFLNLLGSPNLIAPGTQNCGMNVCVIEGIMQGKMSLWPPFEDTKCIVVWGGNPPQANPGLWPKFTKALARGVKLIVVDPRRTETVERADIWLQLRPGTDTALLMGWMNVIINEDLYDKDFVEKWTVGFNGLKERVKKYPPEKVAEITGVPADKIREAARMYATTRPATISWALAVDMIGRNATQGVRARACMRAITGYLDIEGGDLLSGPHPKIVFEGDIEENEKLSPEQRKKQLGADRFKLFTWDTWEKMTEYAKRIGHQGAYSTGYTVKANGPATWRAVLTGKPYPVRAVITISNNPMLSDANTKLVYEAIKKLDLYAVMDYWMTPSAELADYVFPAAGWLERPWLMSNFGLKSNIWAGDKVVGPLYERRDDFQLFYGLGVRMGQNWPWKTIEELYDYRVKPLGYTWKEFANDVRVDLIPHEYKKYERTGFATPSGKVELYSSILEELGYDPLPDYEEPPESPVSTPELTKEYPYILITGGRVRPYFHSEWRQIASLRKMHPEPLVQINPETAAKFGIEEGDWVWIETARGRIKQKAKLFTGIDPTVINCEHCWWFPEKSGEEPSLHGVWESNANVLTDDDLDKCSEMVGGRYLRALLCKIYKA